MKGYQLIESDLIDQLKFVNPHWQKIVVLWVINILKNDPELKEKQIEIEFIYAEYISGEYPCIGIHYLDDSIEDVSPFIQEKLKMIYENYSFKSLYDFSIINKNMLQDELK